MTARARAGDLAAAAGDLFLGAGCHGCGAPGWSLCADCRAVFEQRRPGATVPDPCPPGFPLTVSCGPYDELAAALISAHKEEQALRLGGVLAGRLAASAVALLELTGVAPDERVRLVPVPSAGAAVRRRGLDASWVLASLAARTLRRDGREVRAARWLRQRRGRRDQAGLNAAERAANLAGGLAPSWQAGPLVPGSPARDLRDKIVLVDDVVTSGASLVEAARAMGALGVEVIGAATVAATVRRGRPAASTQW